MSVRVVPGGSQGSAVQRTGGLRLAAILVPLLLCGVAGNYARATFSPLQEAIRLDLGLSDNQIALIQGIAVALPISLAAFPLGFMVDRYNRVRILLALAAINLIGTVLTAVSSSFAMLFLARGLVGLGAYGTAMTIPSLISDLCPPAIRGRAVSLSGIGYVVGRSIAFAVGGGLLVAVGSNADGWQTVMLWLSTPLAAIVLILILLREPARGEVGAAVGASIRERLTEFWRYRGIIAPVVIGFVVAEMADAAALIWAAPIYARDFGLSAAEVGSLIGLVLLLSGVVGMFAGGVVADICQQRGGSRRAILVMALLALIGVPAGCFGLAPGPTSASIMLGLLMIVGSMIAMMSSAILVVAIPNELRGLSMGAALLGNTVFCVGLAPLLVSSLSGALGGPSSLAAALSIVCAVTSLFSALCFLYGVRNMASAPNQQLGDPHAGE